jgi:hypothetical protein
LGGVKIAEQGKRTGWRFLDMFWIEPVDLWVFKVIRMGCQYKQQ